MCPNDLTYMALYFEWVVMRSIISSSINALKANIGVGRLMIGVKVKFMLSFTSS